MVEEYTTKMHIKGLLDILSKKYPCSCCPANEWKMEHDPYLGYDVFYSEYSEACIMCFTFVGSTTDCPCFYFGKDEAIKRTWLKLEELGEI